MLTSTGLNGRLAERRVEFIKSRSLGSKLEGFQMELASLAVKTFITLGPF